jgi:3'-phosphoadenosine 5'-phosphosulfate sulfotransferase (PAPS reductase)/FAD synthetase
LAKEEAHMNYFFMKETSVVSFSGGRSSGYMLYKILEAHNFKLPPYVKVIFANTGKEMPQTLDFVNQVSKQWGVNVVWLEYTGKKQFAEVSYKTASRKGEPFAQLIKDKNYLPNMMARFCTSELKVLTIERYMGGSDFITVVGIRGDEPRRVTKMRFKDNYLVPLADSGITESDVHKFWSNQNFDLEMPPAGINTLSNCDLCFLKGYSIKQSIIEHNPLLADWWILQEKSINARFRNDQPSYEKMKLIASDQGQLFDFDNESIACFCGD